MTSIALAIWNFFDVTSTILMFMACDYLNKVSYESADAQYLSPLVWVYSHPEARFALEYGTMFFLLCTYELVWKTEDSGGDSNRAYDYSGLGNNKGNAGNVYAKLKGVLLTITIISSVLFLWNGLNNAMQLVQGIGFFTGPWKDKVCSS
eukprot:CAMPEP_0184502886 /NCGR_PEP_ID=MMETSP0113_2-20130426/51473_1 /TAXON_ID=91329 /ORGANISM="Norrisiella sphaerica, Strain BC52" /LENGTH=148 /DNA_ID=CAMNT_0026892255 /DNA_START=146 /DNA_END=592 /DNA_ORIENTATION=+